MNPASTFFRACRRRQPAYALPPLRTGQPGRSSRCLSKSSFRASQIEAASSPSPSTELPPLPSNAFTASNGTPTAKPTSQPGQAQEQSDADFLATSFRVIGTVSRIYTPTNTIHPRPHLVLVSRNTQIFDKFLKKHYQKTVTTAVHDPRGILAEGDVVSYGLFPPRIWKQRVKDGLKDVKWVLRDVITPFGKPLEQRQPRVVEDWAETTAQATTESMGRRR